MMRWDGMWKEGQREAHLLGWFELGTQSPGYYATKRAQIHCSHSQVPSSAAPPQSAPQPTTPTPSSSPSSAFFISVPYPAQSLLSMSPDFPAEGFFGTADPAYLSHPLKIFISLRVPA